MGWAFFNMNVPKLRFKDENGQDFPEWEDSTIGELINDKSAKFDPAKHGNKFKCIELEHLSQETGILLGCVDAVNQKSIKNMFKKDDVLFGKLRPYLRKFLKAPFDGVCSTEIWVLKGKKISNNFLYQFVQTEYFLMLANISSGSKMPHADWEVIASAEVEFPSVPEQTKIANFLAAVDEKIEQLIQQVSLLQLYKKGVMQQIFSQQLRFKDEDGNDFPEWEEKTLGELGIFFSGGTPLTSRKDFYNGNIPFIKSGELGLTSTAQTITELGLKKSSAKMVTVGDLLYALYGATSGELAISKIAGAINQAVLCIRTILNTAFLYFYLLFKKQSISPIFSVR